jgi:hypothetical protein
MITAILNQPFDEPQDYFSWLEEKQNAETLEEIEELEAMCQEYELYNNQESEWDL